MLLEVCCSKSPLYVICPAAVTVRKQKLRLNITPGQVRRTGLLPQINCTLNVRIYLRCVCGSPNYVRHESLITGTTKRLGNYRGPRTTSANIRPMRRREKRHSAKAATSEKSLCS